MYDPARFMDVESVDDAVRIILTETEGMTSAQRWAAETPELIRLLERFVMPGSRVLDYGCGIGRLAKPLIDKHRCMVVGIDISPNMRALAVALVDSPLFHAFDPLTFDAMLHDIRPFDVAISVWALQHCIDLQQAIDRIRGAVRQNGRLVIVNNKSERSLPSENGEWTDDGLDIEQMIAAAGFCEIEQGQLDEKIAPGWMQKGTFWAAYRKE